MAFEQTDRIATHPIQPLLLHRWSPRAMTAEPLSQEDLLALFEAARWAPSSYNEQPWRFLYARRETAQWGLFFDLLIPFNQQWVQKAAALGIILSRTHFVKNQKPNPTHAFDTGAAWENLALEGTSRGLVVHGMSGFDRDKARETLRIPIDYEIQAMFAIGKKAAKESLPAELMERERPSDRKKLEEIVSEGTF